MKPDCSAYLRSLARLLADEFAPNAGDDYARTEMTRHGGLLGVVDEAIDSAVAWRFEENRAMRRLFSLALQVPGLDSLATQLGVEAGSEDTDLRLRSLEATNLRMRGLLTGDDLDLRLGWLGPTAGGHEETHEERTHAPSWHRCPAPGPCDAHPAGVIHPSCFAPRATPRRRAR